MHQIDQFINIEVFDQTSTVQLYNLVETIAGEGGLVLYCYSQYECRI